MPIKKKKVDPKVSGLLFHNFNIGTTKPKAFIRDLERLCKKYAARTKNGKDFEFLYDYVD